MRNLVRIALAVGILALVVPNASLAADPAPQRERNSLVIIFKDGHQQSFPVAEIARIEFTSPSSIASTAGRNRFLGRWKVGDGSGGTFYITLERDGNARKSIGSTHGTWTVVEGEARINWNDGWHDAIRKVGNKYQKVAFAPGKSFSDAPDNMTDAENKEANPI